MMSGPMTPLLALAMAEDKGGLIPGRAFNVEVVESTALDDNVLEAHNGPQRGPLQSRGRW